MSQAGAIDGAMLAPGESGEESLETNRRKLAELLEETGTRLDLLFRALAARYGRKAFIGNALIGIAEASTPAVERARWRTLADKHGVDCLAPAAVERAIEAIGGAGVKADPQP